MAITNDAIAAALAATVELDINKASTTSKGAGTWHSLWKAAGLPVAGANPPLFSAGSGYVPTAATAGAWSYTNPTSPAKKYIAQVEAIGTVVGTIIVYDRLWACSGFSSVTTTAQSITTPGTITARDAIGGNAGVGVEVWGEVYTAPGATAATWTVSYTNAAGTAGQSATYAHPASAEVVGQMVPFVMPTAGVQSVQSFTASVSSGTAGDIGITLLRRIAKIPITTANIGQVLDYVSLGLPQVFDNSCIALQVQCSATTTGQLLGGFKLVDLTP